jgi:hypothetical protein
MVETRCGLRENQVRAKSYPLLHVDLHGMARKAVLTVEAVGPVEGSGVEVENLHSFNKTLL